MVEPVVSFNALLDSKTVAQFARLANGSNNPGKDFVDGLNRASLLHERKATVIEPNPLAVPYLDTAWNDGEHKIGIKGLHEGTRQVTIWDDNTISFNAVATKPEQRAENTFALVPDLDSKTSKIGPLNEEFEDLKALSQKLPLLVDPYVAALATYRNNIQAGKQIEAGDFLEEPNRKIFEYLAKAGFDDETAKNFYGIATLMDTASRTPEIMSKGFIEHVMDFYSKLARKHGTKIWMGTGTESLAPYKRGDGAIKAAKGGLTKEQYIAARKEQIDFVHDLNKRYGLRENPMDPIIFPGAEQNGLSDEDNIKIYKELLEYCEKQYGYKSGILHKLGSPFRADTNFVNENVLAGAAGFAQAVKTSHPLLAKQFKDIETIAKAGSKTYTGDDRNFALDWLWGARKALTEIRTQAEKEKGWSPATLAKNFGSPEFYKLLKTHKRNGYSFLSQGNVHALLGYIGLNPKQTVVAIVELTKWFYAELAGQKDSAQQHLDNYMNLMSPAMGMSTQVFFGKTNPTSAYTDFVTRAHQFNGVLDIHENQRPLSHRQMKYADSSTAQKAINGQLLAWQFLTGAVDIKNAKQIVESAKAAQVIG